MNKPLANHHVVICLIVLSVLHTGCATLIKGTSEEVEFVSNPPEVEVYVDGNLMGTTPVKLKLESKKVHQVELKKEGYDAMAFVVTKHVGMNWFIPDLVFWPPISFIRDAESGAWYSLDFNHVDASLRKVGQPGTKESAGLPRSEEVEKLSLSTKRTAYNSFYFEAGGNAVVASFNYDRLFGESFAGRVGLGGIGNEYGGGVVAVPMTLSRLLGTGAHKFELGAGAIYAREYWFWEVNNYLSLTGIVGYRYQPKTKGGVFRVGFTPIFGFNPEEGVLFFPWGGVSFGVAF